MISKDPKAQAPTFVFTIRRHSDITLAVGTALRPSFLTTFSVEERGVVGTVISEIGTNILKYAGHGTIRMHALQDGGKQGVCVEAIDHGPGIKDLEAAFKEGFSTGGTLGLGLSAVRRMMDTLHISCPAAGGTYIEATRWCRHPMSPVPGSSAAPHERLRSVAVLPALASLSSISASAGQPLRLHIETRNRPYRGMHVSGDRAS